MSKSITFSFSFFAFGRSFTFSGLSAARQAILLLVCMAHLRGQDFSVTQRFSYLTSDGLLYASAIQGPPVEMTTGEIGQDPISTFTATDLIINHSSQTDIDLQLGDSMKVFQAVRSPHNKDVWIVGSWNPWESIYELYRLNNGRKHYLPTGAGMDVYKPFAWSKDSHVVYCEVTNLNSTAEHQGIIELNIKTGRVKRLPVTDRYVTSPLISPDRDYLLYSKTDKVDFDQLHGIGSKVCCFNLATQEESILLEDANGIVPVQWYNRSGYGPSRAVAQVPFRLPWMSGICYGVTRHGTPSPSGGYGTTCGTTSTYTAHTYVAVDFDTPNNMYDAIVAVASGFVSFVGYEGNGAGNYVKITHDDGNQSVYMHLNSVAVTQGQSISQGCVIGDGGCTGNCDGDHLHFEYRVGSSKQYATFDDCGCKPKAGKKYMSQNVSCGGSGSYNVYAEDVILSDYTAFVGQELNLDLEQWIAPNTGPAVDVTVRYYWSTNSNSGIDGTNLGSDVSSLGSGDSYDPESFSFFVPSGSGQRYLKIAVDYYNVVSESNENNVTVIPVTVSSAAYDVFADFIQLNDYSVYVGQSLELDWEQWITPSTGPNVSITAKYYWSSNSNNGINGTLLGSDVSQIGGGDPYDGESFSFNVPGGTGWRYLKIAVDYTNAVPNESNEQNVFIVAVFVSSNGSAPVDEGPFILQPRGSIIDESAGVLHLSPNPVSDRLKIEFPFIANENISLLILTQLGEVVQRVRLSGTNTVELDVSELPGGVYLVQVASGERNYLSKFIIAK